eukprot:TRINITY_DN38617_c0_g1_i3.p2 TRINITY_DN38617_c0_g1~~TRINITY_DN38617_c0_g1_i3.p2  ORF type:complete len:185 (-),score=16.23 TRINITY_DN38617_c0_g1_i3:51-605(-)
MSSVAEPSPAHVADSPAQDPPAEQQGDADSESAASEPVHLFLVEDLKTFPTIAVSGVEADDKANGDYFPTLYGDLSDGYSSSFWAKRSGRMAWERRYQPENCTPEESARALEAAQQRENATVRYRHMAGSRRRLVEGPPNDGGEQRHREMPPESGWRFIGPGTPDGTFYNLNGEPAGSVVVQYK